MACDTDAMRFDELADCYWRLGVLSSPAQLQGYALGMLVVGYECSDSQWLALAEAFIDPVQSPNEADRLTLLELMQEAKQRLRNGGMDLHLLLPDDEVEISLRVDALGQWCQGFLAGFAYAGKQLAEQQKPQQFSKEVSEMLSDIAAIAQAGLGDGDEEEAERERSFFDLTEYLRLAAINVYLDCTGSAADPASNTAVASEPAAASTHAADLFGRKPGKDKLH